MNALKIFGQYSVKILNIQSAKLSTKTKVSSPKQIPIISSRRKEFNLYRADFVESKSNAEFGSIPLASNGWRHHKSKGDFFILHPNEISFFFCQIFNGRPSVKIFALRLVAFFN
jgi:hypothetical protein